MPQEQNTIVNYHNELRNAVYAGNTHLPAASGSGGTIANLQWNADLAVGAQKYAAFFP